MWKTVEFRSTEYMKIAKEIMDIHADKMYMIGTVGLGPMPIIINKDLKNVPKTGPAGAAINFAAISIIAFIVIQLPPGDFVDYLEMRDVGYEAEVLSDEEIANLRHKYGLDKPLYMQYFYWAGNFLRGDFGIAFLWEEPIAKLIAERTMVFGKAGRFPDASLDSGHRDRYGRYCFADPCLSRHSAR